MPSSQHAVSPERLISRELPALLRGLTDREGARPRVDPRHPCPQVEQVAPAGLRGDLLGWVTSLPGVSLGAPSVTVPDAVALGLDADLALGQPEAFIMRREFAYVRREGDGSVHLTLYPEWGAEVMRRGWCALHPLALYGLIPPQNAIVYAPRDAAELAVLQRVVAASYCFARGELVDVALEP